jgi:hypothetical protein
MVSIIGSQQHKSHSNDNWAFVSATERASSVRMMAAAMKPPGQQNEASQKLLEEITGQELRAMALQGFGMIQV